MKLSYRIASSTLLATLVSLSTVPSFAQQTSREALLDPPRIQFEGDAVPMTLREVVLTAFEQNLDIEIRLVDKDIAKNTYQAEQGVYDPTLSSSVTASNVDDQSPTVGAGDPPRARYGTETNSDSLTAGAEISQLLPTGATVGLGFTSARTAINRPRNSDTAVSPYVDQRAYLAIRQPLLKNFGPNVTNAGIRVAEAQRKVATAQYRQEVIDQTAAVMSAYWDVVFAIRNLEVQRASLEAALELERVNGVRVETGASPRADLLQAQAQVAERRNALIQAKSGILNAQDVLLSILNWNAEGTRWNAPIQPLDKPDQYNLTTLFDDQTLISDAIVNRPDFRAAELGIDIAQINRDVAKWQRLPQVDLIGEYGFNGLGDDSSEAFREVRQNDYEDGFVGLELRYPLLNRRPRAEYRRSENELRRSELLLQQAELRIITQVRSATRQIRTAQESIEASQAQVKAARETLEVERRRLDVGGSTTFNVLQFQEDLAGAEVAEVQALVNFQKGQIELERSRGSLLDQLGRELDVQFQFEEALPDSKYRSKTTTE